MNRFIAITKTILKSSLNIGGLKNKKSKRINKKNSSIVLSIVIFALFLLVGYSLFYSFKYLFEISLTYNFTQILVQSLIPIAIMLFLCLSMTLLTSVFFLSNDNEVFLPLPIKPRELFFSRFVVVLIYTYLMELIFVLPILIAYNFVISPSFIGYVSQLIFFIIFPIIPLSIGFLISLLIAKVFNISKHKDAFSIIMATIFIVIVVGIQFGSSFLNSNQEIAGDPSEAIETMSSTFSFLRFYTGYFDRAIIYDNLYGLGQIGIISGISIAILLICYFVANFTYIKSIKGSGDGSSSHKRNTKAEALKGGFSKNHFINLTKKEIKTLFRTPIYVFNLIIPPLLIIVIFSVSFISGLLGDSSGSLASTLNSIQSAIKPYLNMDNGYIILIMVCISLFISSTSAISSTAISREGNNAYMIKTYPVDVFTIINSKVIVAIFIDALFTIIIQVTLTILFKASFWLLLTSLLLSIGTIVLTNYLMILIDLNSPTLNFTNETAAVKQNKSVIFGMLVDFGILIIFGLLTYLFIKVPLNGWIVFLIIGIIIALINLWLILFIKYKGKNLYNKF